MPLTTLQKLRKLRHPTPTQTLYEICFRNAGWGIVFHDVKKGPEVSIPHPNPRLAARGITTVSPCWREGLYVERYYRTFAAAVNAEYKRFFGGKKAT